MQHPDEHTLSLFALREGLATRLRESVERHLAKCSGCRSQVEELEAVYAHAEKRLVDEVLAHPEQASESLAPSVVAITPERNVRSVHLSDAVGGALQRFVDFARRRPIVTGVGTLAFASLAFLGVNAAWEAGKGFNEAQPALLRMNPLRSAVEVYSKDDAHLWDFSVHVKSEDETSILLTRALTSGFLGNGKTQVLTCLPFEEGNGITLNAIRAFDQRGNPLWVKRFGRQVTFRGEPYVSFYGVRTLVTVAGDGDPGKRDIYVSATDDRSPSAIVKVGGDSSTRGEYWHFGHLPWVGAGHIAGREDEVLFSFGVNDVGDRVDSSFPAIVVLDPKMIAGQTESSVTPGFGFSASRAELFYIRADQRRLHIPLSGSSGKTGFRALKIADDGSLTFQTKAGTPTGLPGISYTFDSSLRLVSVWLDDLSRRILVEELLGSAKAVDAYLLELQGAVRYWDGKAWRAEVTPVAHNQNSP